MSVLEANILFLIFALFIASHQHLLSGLATIYLIYLKLTVTVTFSL